MPLWEALSKVLPELQPQLEDMRETAARNMIKAEEGRREAEKAAGRGTEEEEEKAVGAGAAAVERGQEEEEEDAGVDREVDDASAFGEVMKKKSDGGVAEEQKAEELKAADAEEMKPSRISNSRPTMKLYVRQASGNEGDEVP